MANRRAGISSNLIVVKPGGLVLSGWVDGATSYLSFFLEPPGVMNFYFICIFALNSKPN